MGFVLAFVVVFAAGVIVGAIFHAILQRDYANVVADVQTVVAEIKGVIVELRAAADAVVARLEAAKKDL